MGTRVPIAFPDRCVSPFPPALARITRDELREETRRANGAKGHQDQRWSASRERYAGTPALRMAPLPANVPSIPGKALPARNRKELRTGVRIAARTWVTTYSRQGWLHSAR